MDFASFVDRLGNIQLPDVASFDHFSASGGGVWAGADTVLVGCGSWQHMDSQQSAPLLLQNKGAGKRFGMSFTSVTKFVREAPDEYFESWTAWPQGIPDLQVFVSGLRLVGEDGSPDSVFALLLLLSRAARVPANRFPEEWIRAVDDWERTGTAENPFRSWCSLESSLAHSSLTCAELTGPSVYTKAWQDGLRFAAASLKEGYSPYSLPMQPTTYHHGKALSALEHDERVYQEWLQQTPFVQLSLPVSDLPDRFRLVDTLFIEEAQLAGAAKNFYRNDTVNSPLKEGFTLSVVHRSRSSEAKPDVTITVDPRKRVTLLKLWGTLEEAENVAWQSSNEIRPSDPVRDLEGVTSSFTEPWFINPDRTLIGAPRKVAGNFAGRLSWPEIQDLILRECNPLNNVRVSPSEGSAPVPILSLSRELREGAPQNPHKGEKGLIMAVWPQESAKEGILLPSVLPQAPTVRRLLATLTKPDRTSTDISMIDLVADSTFDQVGLIGGFAIVSDWGVFVLDDWSKEMLEHEILRRTFDAGARIHIRLLTEFEDEFGDLSCSLTKLLKYEPKARRRDVIVNRLSVLSLQVAHLRGSSSVVPANPNARTLKRAIDKRWSLEDRLSSLEDQIKAMESSLRGLNDARIESVNRFIAVDGFALFVASGLASPVAKTIYHIFGAGKPAGDAPGWCVLAAFGVLTVVLLCVLHFWVNRTDPLRRFKE